MTFPSEITTKRLVLRPFVAGDAAALNAAVAESVEHLRPFMAWAEPAMTLEERIAWITAPDNGVNYPFGMFLRDGTLVGSSGFHRRIGPGGVEIGYWVHVDHVARGLATEATRALTDVAFDDPSVDRVEIHHDQANIPSGRIPARVGYRRIEERPREITAPAETGVNVVWRLTRDEWVVARSGAGLVGE